MFVPKMEGSSVFQAKETAIAYIYFSSIVPGKRTDISFARLNFAVETHVVNYLIRFGFFGIQPKVNILVFFGTYRRPKIAIQEMHQMSLGAAFQLQQSGK